MLKNIKKIVLAKTNRYEFVYKALLIFLNRFPSKIELRTLVFSENNFIPFSVRNCVHKVWEKNLSNKDKKNTFSLQIDETHSCVYFVQGISGEVNLSLFKLIRLFSFAARAWAVILKKMAQNDLLYS